MRKAHILSDQQIKFYREFGSKALAKEIGITRIHLNTLLRKQNISKPNISFILTSEIIESCIQNGISFTAKKYNISYPNLYSRIKSKKITTPRSDYRSFLSLEEINKLRIKGLTFREIGKKAGVSDSAIWHFLRRNRDKL